MKLVAPQLYVGTIDDYNDLSINESWYTVSLAKDPLHRQMVGYTGRACDKSNPEYLYAVRENGIFCNLIDVDDVNYIHKSIIDAAVDYAVIAINRKKNVLVCCNKAESRSPIIAMLIMKRFGYFKNLSFEESEIEFKKIYSQYNPKRGMQDYSVIHWNEY